MKLYRVFSLIGIVSLFGLATSFCQNENVESRDASIILEFNDNLDYKDAVNYIRHNITSDFEITSKYSSLFNGIVIKCNSTYETYLDNVPGVVSCEMDSKHYINTDSTYYTESISTNDNLSALTINKPSGTSEGAGTSIAIIDSSFYLQHECYSALSGSVATKYTASDIETIKAQPGFHGSGTTYFNNKVPYYYDYGGNGNVFTSLNDHGHHVASLAGGNGATYKGIAPNSQLLLMKVFTVDNTDPKNPTMYCSSENILKALEDCVLLDVDIINLSLGNDLDDFNDDSLVNKKVKELQDKGTFVNFAAGNSGKDQYASYGLYKYWDTSLVETGIMSEYTNRDISTAVAASSSSYYYYENAITIGENTFPYTDQVTDYYISQTGEYIHYNPQRKFSDIGSYFSYAVIPNNGEEKDYDGIDVNGKVAVINRGVTTFLEKVNIAVSHGAIGAIIINNETDVTSFSFRMAFQDSSGKTVTPSIPVALVLYNSSSYFAEGTYGKIVSNYIYEGTSAMADFSSDGATYDLNLKPDITAPGYLIKGAVYKRTMSSYSTTAYDYYSGTSMASPNYSGALAVALGEHLGDSEYRSSLTSRMMSTANILVDKDNHISPRKQGSGMVNIEQAIDSPIYIKGIDYSTNQEINYGKILLRNSENISKGVVDLKFNVYNTSSYTIPYDVKVSVYSPDTSSYQGITIMSTSDVKIATFTEQITVNPGKNVIDLSDYSLSSEIKNELNNTFANGCVIEGYVELTPHDIVGGYNVSVPFLGFYGDYFKGAPVEAFKFEKEENTLYPSSYVNSLLSSLLGSSFKGDFSSRVVEGYAGSINDIDMDSIFSNSASYESLNFKDVTASFDEDKNMYKITVYTKSNINTLIFQQFVTRSVKSNTFTITDLSSDKVILNDNMFDSLTNETSLFKSIVSKDLSDSNIYAHRAYSLIPLYDSETKVFYNVGTYRIDMNYELSCGGTYSASYLLELTDKETPVDPTKKTTIDYLAVAWIAVGGVALIVAGVFIFKYGSKKRV